MLVVQIPFAFFLPSIYLVASPSSVSVGEDATNSLIPLRVTLTNRRQTQTLRLQAVDDIRVKTWFFSNSVDAFRAPSCRFGWTVASQSSIPRYQPSERRTPVLTAAPEHVSAVFAHEAPGADLHGVPLSRSSIRVEYDVPIFFSRPTESERVKRNCCRDGETQKREAQRERERERGIQRGREVEKQCKARPPRLRNDLLFLVFR